MTNTERITHGALPHWYKPGFAHFITYRLAGSIPLVKLREWREERQRRVQSAQRDIDATHGPRERAHKQFFARYDEYLDQHANLRWLEEPAVAELIRENLYYHRGSRYELIAWCIMPNHVHVVLQPFETCIHSQAANVDRLRSSEQEAFHSEEIADSASVLSRIMHSLKSYTANRANEFLNRSGSFWQSESYDHWVRDINELERIVDYIRFNPVRAELCDRPEQWRFSSAFDRYQKDGSMTGLVGWLRDDWRR